MEGMVDSGFEIRRIILLTRLKAVSKGMTMGRLVKDCTKVAGWNVTGKTPWEVVRLVLQSLIDDGLAAVKARFVLTAKGREYLENPFKWRLDRGTTEEVDRKIFWDSIHETFDKAYRRLRPKTSTSRVTET